MLRALHDLRVATVSELAKAAGVSRPTTEEALATLVTQGLAAEVRPEPAAARAVGRPARRFEFNARVGHVVGVDVGVGEIRAVTVDLRGTVVAQESALIRADSSTEVRLGEARSVMRRCAKAARVEHADILAVGVASTGIIDDNGRVALSFRLPDLPGTDLSEALRVFGTAPVLVGNDARLGTLAESWLGAARGIGDVVNVVTGRHLTAGIMLDGVVRLGRHGAAGEIAVLPEAGWRAALELIESQGDPIALFAAAGAGDAAAIATVDRFTADLSVGIAALVLAVDPDCVVVSGPLARAGEHLLAPLRTQLARRCLFPLDVRASTLGPDAVALGAAKLALTEVERDLFDSVH
ncbi:ROK family protein [Kitasatospora purpeofusca]|uniref:ROK family protein n=1 Tax=Kitasatospora purpeofusca TaxID=67352 RepID=UPI0030F258B6